MVALNTMPPSSAVKKNSSSWPLSRSTSLVLNDSPCAASGSCSGVSSAHVSNSKLSPGGRLGSRLNWAIFTVCSFSGAILVSNGQPKTAASNSETVFVAVLIKSVIRTKRATDSAISNRSIDSVSPLDIKVLGVEIGV